LQFHERGPPAATTLVAQTISGDRGMSAQDGVNDLAQHPFAFTVNNSNMSQALFATLVEVVPDERADLARLKRM
jgi:hypothetical protein